MAQDTCRRRPRFHRRILCHPLSSNQRKTTLPANGIQTIRSAHSVVQTLQKLETALHSKGVTIFALIDHSGEAEKVGLHMPPTRLVIFGNPKGGTPLMLAAPSIAIDLPLKILIAEDREGLVHVSWNTSDYLQHRHGLPETLLPNLAFMAALVAGITA